MDSPPQHSSNQFTLQSLFSWMTLVALCLLAVTVPLPLGLAMAFVGIMSLLIFTGKLLASDGIPILLIGFLLIMMLPPVFSRGHRRPAVRTMCSNNVRQLALAMLNYESAFGEFPPAYTVDANGRRLHSWRTLILPYVGEADRFNKIDLTLPWDHPINQAAALPIPEFYRCPVDNKLGPKDATTPYIGIIGENLIFRNDGQSTKLSEMTDGTSNTLAVIESNQHRLHWMSPGDLQYSKLLELLEDPNYKFTDSHHEGGCNAARSDGSVKFLRESMSKEAIKSALQFNDGVFLDF